MGDGLSQDDLDNLFSGIQPEAKKPEEMPGEALLSDGLSQDDLDNLFSGIQLETRKPKEMMETKNIETSEASETLTQDQIDALLKEMLGS